MARGLLLPARASFGRSRARGYGSSLLTFAEYQALVLSERKGFAGYGSVTGGQGATSPTVVSNTNNAGAGSLRAAMESSGTRWIVFDPNVFPPGSETTITTSSYIELRNAHSNFTLDGYGSRVRLTGWGIRTAVYEAPAIGASDICNNFIINNLKIDGIGLGEDNDCIQHNGSDRFWYHHLDLSEGGDGNLDIINVYAGPNSVGYGTISNTFCHDSLTGKGVLLGDQTEVGGGDYAQTSSDFNLGGNGGDCKITICDSRFEDTLRNPVVSNYHVHNFNSLHRNWTVEGPAIWGLMGHLRQEYCVMDGTGSSNPDRGLVAWHWGLYSDPGREYKRLSETGNCYLGGATFYDQSGGTLNPSGSIFTIPYAYTPETPLSDSGAALIARIAASSETTLGRAGRIQRPGYYSLVLGQN